LATGNSEANRSSDEDACRATEVGQRAGHGGGFTLIELSIVVFIMSIMMAVSVPYFARSYNTSMVSSAARTFMTTCQLARFRAVLQQQNAVLHVDVGGQKFWLMQVGTSEFSDSPHDQVIKVFGLPGRVTLVSAQVGDEAARGEGEVSIQFYPNGSCDAASVVFSGIGKDNIIGLTLDPLTAKATPAEALP
jgi:prepilin-type N-terminal cleavage/methylation domain-containing protein